MKTYKLIIEKGEDGFWGRIDFKDDLVTSFGETIDQLKTNMKEALKLYFEDSSKPIPNYNFELVMDIQEFFLVNDFINISTLAKRIGMNSSLLRQYAKGIKFPSLKQVSKIENAIRKIGKQLSSTELQPN
ncbi:type II toxin-antitoxin system HicB family antitoxin [Portibacter marinus]|uniref:type II toxin-antitoxin system HicB family antitoxin n=1 Tax=Portibacter marinus TaxID=2898660 RepID=UPI001F1D398C|nr:type II toxin-antitoxin system HicB family antitoxin [Portibacter marinus]